MENALLYAFWFVGVFGWSCALAPDVRRRLKKVPQKVAASVLTREQQTTLVQLMVGFVMFAVAATLASQGSRDFVITVMAGLVIYGLLADFEIVRKGLATRALRQRYLQNDRFGRFCEISAYVSSLVCYVLAWFLGWF
ncbi:MAG TPA: hypothetical protein VFT64_06180 [Rickettsiales bacterium]|nr:hypothetical protein [Rickettsiales bacterium]